MSGRDRTGIAWVVGAVAGGLYVAVLDLFVPSAGAASGSFGDTALAGLTSLSIAALLAMLGAGGGATLSWASRKAGVARHWTIGVVLGIAVIVWNLETFSGASISASAWHPVLVWGHRLLAIPAGIALVAYAERTRERPRAFGFAIAGFIGFAVARYATVLEHYPDVRLQLFVLSAIGAGVGFVAALPPFSRRGALAFGGAALSLVIAGVVVRHTNAWPRVAAVVASRSTVAPVAEPVTETLFRLVSPGPPAEPAGDDPAYFDAASEPEDAARLDTAIPGRRKLNVLFVTLDTVRADVVGCLGGRDDVTPRLDAFAKNATVFESAYTTYPTSKWAYGSLLSGLHARCVPASDHDGSRGFLFPPGTTLPELLSSHGWFTAAVTAFNAETVSSDRWFGTLRRGFEVFNPDQDDESLPADRVLESVETSVLPRLHNDRPWFLWVHLLDPHAPYGEGTTPSGAKGLFGAYLGDVRVADTALGSLLTALRARDLLDHTIVVVCADHGEEFLEHGSTRHGTNLYEQQTRVPLVLDIPKLAARRIAAPASLADVHPTVVELLGVKDPLPRTGRSLVPELLGRHHESGGFAFMEQFRPSGDGWERNLEALRFDRWKLVRQPRTGRVELYDIVDDPAESRNLFGHDARRDRMLFQHLATMGKRVDAWQQGRSAHDDSVEGFRTRTDELLDEATSASATFGVVRTLSHHLFDLDGSLRPAAKRALGEDRVTRVLDALLAAYTTFDDTTRLAVLHAVATTPWLPARAAIRKLWDAGEGPRPPLAVVLAWLGDDAGLDLITKAFQTDASVAKDLVAAALANLGDPSGALWLHHNVLAGSTTVLCSTLKGLPGIRKTVLGPVVPRLIGRRLRDYVIVPIPVARVATATLDHWPDEEATALLTLLATHSDPAVRDTARGALRRRLPPDRLLPEIEATLFALEGDGLVRHHRFDEAITRYDECLQQSRLPRHATGFRVLHALRLGGRTDEVKTRARALATAIDDGRVAKVARRHVPLADHPVLLDPRRFRARFETRNDPGRTGRNVMTAFVVSLTNPSPQAWTGGPGWSGCYLHVRWQRPDGTWYRSGTTVRNWLPEAGVLPGETLSMMIVGHTPPVAGEFTPVLFFAQQPTRLPEAGRLGPLR